MDLPVFFFPRFTTRLSDAERNAQIAERQRRSVLWRIIHRGGSLQLAMVLLLTIALACAIATVAESRISGAVAHYYIYKSPWFLLWLGVLATNLFCVTLTRWPWQAKHLGFVVTHYGIILVLGGAALGRLSGFEGFINLETGAASQERVVLNQPVIEAIGLRTETPYVVHLPFEAVPPTETRPRFMEVPESQGKLRLKFDGYADALSIAERLAESPLPTSGPGVELHFASRMMGQQIELALLRDSETARLRDFFGLAAVEWADGSVKSIPRAIPTLRVGRAVGGMTFFQLFRQGKPYAEGTLQPGIPVMLGWADWAVTLTAAIPHAALKEEVAAEGGLGVDSAPGVRASLMEGEKILDGPLWLLSGRTQSFRGPEGHPIEIGYGLQTKPLPFTVRLLKFEVPRDEGTETPSDFISTVEFSNRTGRTQIGEAHMNYPASFPGGFWRSALGLNYKFSQASWNPQDLRQATLQVLYDPGWPLKWIGSILVIIGITLLFYYKPGKSPKAPQVLSTEIADTY